MTHSRGLSSNTHLPGVKRVLRNYVQQILTQRRRRQYASRTDHPEMRDYLASPTVDPKTSYRKLEYLVVDLEMSGLDASRDQQ